MTTRITLTTYPGVPLLFISAQQADILGRVQAILCPRGTENAAGCQAKADTRGDGLGVVLLGQ